MASVGLGIQTDRDAAFYLQIAKLAEEAGFDVLSVFNDAGFPPAFPVLHTLAGATKHIRLGPACVNPFTMELDEIVEEFGRLQETASSRAYLGLARGAWLEPQLQPSPLKALRAAIAHVRKRLPYSPDLLVGTWGARTAAMAGELGVNEIKIGGSANPEMVRAMLGYLNEYPNPPAIVIGAVTVIDADRDLARARARQAAALYIPVVAPLDPTLSVDASVLNEINEHVEAGDLPAAASLITDEMLERFAFAGTADEVAGQAIKLFAAGAARVEFGSPFGIDSLASVETIGEEVLPLFRNQIDGAVGQDRPEDRKD